MHQELYRNLQGSYSLLKLVFWYVVEIMAQSEDQTGVAEHRGTERPVVPVNFLCLHAKLEPICSRKVDCFVAVELHTTMRGEQRQLMTDTSSTADEGRQSEAYPVIEATMESPWESDHKLPWELLQRKHRDAESDQVIRRNLGGHL